MYAKQGPAQSLCILCSLTLECSSPGIQMAHSLISSSFRCCVDREVFPCITILFPWHAKNTHHYLTSCYIFICLPSLESWGQGLCFVQWCIPVMMYDTEEVPESLLNKWTQIPQAQLVLNSLFYHLPFSSDETLPFHCCLSCHNSSRLFFPTAVCFSLGPQHLLLELLQRLLNWFPHL